ncbi:MAG: hypothetical protein AB7G13_27790, partial [Lautropia sp.]
MKVVCLWHATEREIERIRTALPPGTEVVAAQGEYFSRFDCEPHEVRHLVADADAFIGFSYPRGLVDLAPKLKIFCWLHSGVDDIDQLGVLAAARHRGFKVTNVRGANAIAVAEQAMMFELALAKTALM